MRNEVGRILGERNINPQGYDFDRNHLGRTNFVIMKAAIDRRVNQAVNRGARERHDFTQGDLDVIEMQYKELISAAIREIFDA